MFMSLSPCAIYTLTSRVSPQGAGGDYEGADASPAKREAD